MQVPQQRRLKRWCRSSRRRRVSGRAGPQGSCLNPAWPYPIPSHPIPSHPIPSHPIPSHRDMARDRMEEGPGTHPTALCSIPWGIPGLSLPGLACVLWPLPQPLSSGCARSLPGAAMVPTQEQEPTVGRFHRTARVPAAIPTWAGPAVTAQPSTALGTCHGTSLSSCPSLTADLQLHQEHSARRDQQHGH